MVEFQAFSEKCKWRGSRVCKAIGNYCEVDNCALYPIVHLKEAIKHVIATGNFATSERHPNGDITEPYDSIKEVSKNIIINTKGELKVKNKKDAGDKALEKMGLK